MEYPGPRLAKGQVLSLPERIGTPRVKERASTIFHLRHYIRIGGGRFVRCAEMSRANLMLPANSQDLLAQRVASNQTRSKQRKAHTTPGQIYQNVERSASCPL